MEILRVPTLSFVAMAVSAVLSVGTPIALFFVARKRTGKGILPVLVGGAGFLLFAVVLEQLLHFFVLRPDADGSVALMRRPFLYMLYGALVAGIFKETARFVSFHILKKRCGGFGTALKHGIGHGGIEAVFIGGASMVSGMALAAMFNSLGAQGLAAMGEPVLAQAQAIAAAPPATLLLSGLERLMALFIQISLSVIVFYAVYEPRRVWLYPLAVLLHALVDCPAALFQAGVLTRVWLVECVVLASMLVIAALAALLHKLYKQEEAQA